jgi:hypothetical protein
MEEMIMMFNQMTTTVSDNVSALISNKVEQKIQKIEKTRAKQLILKKIELETITY